MPRNQNNLPPPSQTLLPSPTTLSQSRRWVRLLTTQLSNGHFKNIGRALALIQHNEPSPIKKCWSTPPPRAEKGWELYEGFLYVKDLFSLEVLDYVFSRINQKNFSLQTILKMFATDNPMILLTKKPNYDSPVMPFLLVLLYLQLLTSKPSPITAQISSLFDKLYKKSLDHCFQPDGVEDLLILAFREHTLRFGERPVLQDWKKGVTKGSWSLYSLLNVQMESRYLTLISLKFSTIYLTLSSQVDMSQLQLHLSRSLSRIPLYLPREVEMIQHNLDFLVKQQKYLKRAFFTEEVLNGLSTLLDEKTYPIKIVRSALKLICCWSEQTNTSLNSRHKLREWEKSSLLNLVESVEKLVHSSPSQLNSKEPLLPICLLFLSDSIPLIKSFGDHTPQVALLDSFVKGSENLSDITGTGWEWVLLSQLEGELLQERLEAILSHTLSCSRASLSHTVSYSILFMKRVTLALSSLSPSSLARWVSTVSPVISSFGGWISICGLSALLKGTSGLPQSSLKGLDTDLLLIQPLHQFLKDFPELSFEDVGNPHSVDEDQTVTGDGNKETRPLPPLLPHEMVADIASLWGAAVCLEYLPLENDVKHNTIISLLNSLHFSLLDTPSILENMELAPARLKKIREILPLSKLVPILTDVIQTLDSDSSLLFLSSSLLFHHYVYETLKNIGFFVRNSKETKKLSPYLHGLCLWSFHQSRAFLRKWDVSLETHLPTQLEMDQQADGALLLTSLLFNVAGMVGLDALLAGGGGGGEDKVLARIANLLKNSPKKADSLVYYFVQNSETLSTSLPPPPEFSCGNSLSPKYRYVIEEAEQIVSHPSPIGGCREKDWVVFHVTRGVITSGCLTQHLREEIVIPAALSLLCNSSASTHSAYLNSLNNLLLAFLTPNSISDGNDSESSSKSLFFLPTYFRLLLQNYEKPNGYRTTAAAYFKLASNLNKEKIGIFQYAIECLTSKIKSIAPLFPPPSQQSNSRNPPKDQTQTTLNKPLNGGDDLKKNGLLNVLLLMITLVDLKYLNLLLHQIRTLVTELEPSDRVAVCQQLQKIIADNFDDSRKHHCIEWFLTLVDDVVPNSFAALSSPSPNDPSHPRSSL